MSRNMGKIDRRIRLILGVAILLTVFTGPHTRWGWLGLILIATSLVGICPLYSLFGWTTCPREFAKR